MASTKSVVLKTRTKKEEKEKADRITQIERKIDLLLAKITGSEN